MCGIYGCVGKNAYSNVIKGLKLLQYRGYDSCGVAYYKDKFIINKAIGTLDNLPSVNEETQIAFGHTRWATNGIVNVQNAHPHVSFDNKITIVHNGIIKNAHIIKTDLIDKGIPFYSETDTEVIANLIAYQMRNKPLEEILSSIFDELEGTFSVIIGTDAGDLYLIKKFSPLNVLLMDNKILISSDITSLKDGMLYTLKDNDILKISENKVTRVNDCNAINYINHKNQLKEINLNHYKYYMEKEIYETPASIYKTYKHLINNNVINKLNEYSKITLIGCGTAYHSCLIGEYLFKNELNKEVETLLASNYIVSSKINNKHLHIIVSQSGETADCIKVAEQIIANGGKFLLITNESQSTISKMTNLHIFTQAEKEFAVASTKTYCCQVFVFAYITNKLKNPNYSLDIDDFVQNLNDYLININVCEVAEQLKDTDKLIMIAKGIDYLTLLEASLKIREIDYIYTLPMYAGELKHGTLSLIDKFSIVLAFNTDNDSSTLQHAINEISSREGRVISIASNIPSSVDRYFKPIYAIIPFQLLSYHIALLHGRNPDMPRNLAKSVTVE